MGRTAFGLYITVVNWHLTPAEIGYIVVEGFKSYEQALAAASLEPLADQPRGADMLYSSGTTGRPKGIKLPLPDRQVGDPPGDTYTAIFGPLYAFESQSVYLSPAPLYHAAPLRFGGAVNALGGTLVVMEKFDAKLALATIERHRVTHGCPTGVHAGSGTDGSRLITKSSRRSSTLCTDVGPMA